jgi:hypothetical protein
MRFTNNKKKKKMANEDSEFSQNEQANFRRYSSKLASMVFRNDETFRTQLNQVLDQLNALEYSLKIAGDQVRTV